VPGEWWLQNLLLLALQAVEFGERNAVLDEGHGTVFFDPAEVGDRFGLAALYRVVEAEETTGLRLLVIVGGQLDQGGLVNFRAEEADDRIGPVLGELSGGVG
jgi:hypothetical protein